MSTLLTIAATFRSFRITSVAPLVVTLAITIMCGGTVAHSATPANARSAIGINLSGIGINDPEQPFLNIFKTTAVSKTSPSGWITHSSAAWDTGEEQYLQLDQNGYPTTLIASSSDPHSPQLFSSVGVLLLRNLPLSERGTELPYRPGRYVVLYDGTGTLSFGFDAKLVSSSPGRDVIDISEPTNSGGIRLDITRTDPGHTGDYIRNIRVVKSEEEGLLDEGYVFRPGFLELLRNFRVLRFMDWLKTNGNDISSWADRPLPSNAGWGTNRGAPLEVAVDLCNAVGADCWLNVPIGASDDYISKIATLVHQQLGSAQRVYVELSNEVWNGVFPQYGYAANQGKAAWPTASVSDFDLNRSWFGMRTAQMCDIWRSVWGSDWSRVTCVLGAQAANPYSAVQALKCPLWTGTGNAPCYEHGIGAVAIAPYFGGNIPATWTSAQDGGLADLFNSVTNQNAPGIPAGGWLGQVSAWEAAYKTALAPYNLPFLGYEGGQSFVGFPASRNGFAVVNLFIKANRDPRMGTAYTEALNDWKANGGQTYVLYDDVSGPSQYGEWGALESFMDPVFPLAKAPPKWAAIQNFISANPCWWSACIGSSTAPQAPNAPVAVQSNSGP